MNKKIKTAVIAAAAALIIAVPTVFIASGSKYAAEIISPGSEASEKNSVNFLSGIGFDEQNFISEWASSTEKINYISVNGNNVYFDYICCEKNDYTASTVILLPDNGMDNTAVSPVADALLKNGFNVIMLDQRAHGRNNAETFTFGLLEKDDIDAVIDYMINNYPYLPSVGLFGQGSGAVTAAYYISSGNASEYIDYAVLEDPYLGSSDYIEKRIAGQKSFLPSSLQRSLTLSAMESKFSFDPEEVSILESVADTDTPIMIISQEGCDNYNCEYSETLYNAINNEDKLLLTVSEPVYLKSSVSESESEKYISESVKFINDHHFTEQ